MAEPRTFTRFMILTSPWPMISSACRSKSAWFDTKNVVWPESP